MDNSAYGTSRTYTEISPTNSHHASQSTFVGHPREPTVDSYNTVNGFVDTTHTDSSPSRCPCAGCNYACCLLASRRRSPVDVDRIAMELRLFLADQERMENDVKIYRRRRGEINDLDETDEYLGITEELDKLARSAPSEAVEHMASSLAELAALRAVLGPIVDTVMVSALYGLRDLRRRVGTAVEQPLSVRESRHRHDDSHSLRFGVTFDVQEAAAALGDRLSGEWRGRGRGTLQGGEAGHEGLPERRAFSECLHEGKQPHDTSSRGRPYASECLREPRKSPASRSQSVEAIRTRKGSSSSTRSKITTSFGVPAERRSSKASVSTEGDEQLRCESEEKDDFLYRSLPDLSAEVEDVSGDMTSWVGQLRASLSEDSTADIRLPSSPPEMFPADLGTCEFFGGRALAYSTGRSDASPVKPVSNEELSAMRNEIVRITETVTPDLMKELFVTSQEGSEKSEERSIQSFPLKLTEKAEVSVNWQSKEEGDMGNSTGDIFGERRSVSSVFRSSTSLLDEFLRPVESPYESKSFEKDENSAAVNSAALASETLSGLREQDLIGQSTPLSRHEQDGRVQVTQKIERSPTSAEIAPRIALSPQDDEKPSELNHQDDNDLREREEPHCDDSVVSDLVSVSQPVKVQISTKRSHDDNDSYYVEKTNPELYKEASELVATPESETTSLNVTGAIIKRDSKGNGTKPLVKIQTEDTPDRQQNSVQDYQKIHNVFDSEKTEYQQQLVSATSENIIIGSFSPSSEPGIEQIVNDPGHPAPNPNHESVAGNEAKIFPIILLAAEGKTPKELSNTTESTRPLEGIPIENSLQSGIENVLEAPADVEPTSNWAPYPIADATSSMAAPVLMSATPTTIVEHLPSPATQNAIESHQRAKEQANADTTRGSVAGWAFTVAVSPFHLLRTVLGPAVHFRPPSKDVLPRCENEAETIPPTMPLSSPPLDFMRSSWHLPDLGFVFGRTLHQAAADSIQAITDRCERKKIRGRSCSVISTVMEESSSED